MKDSQKLFKAVIMYAWAVILTMLTFVFGAVFYNGLFKLLGRGLYWLSFLGLSFLFFGLGFKVLAISLFSMTFLIGVFNEFRAMGSNNFVSGMASTFFTGSLLGFFGMYWFKTLGPDWHSLIVTKATAFLQQALPPNSDILAQMKVVDLVNQVPSGIFILAAFSLYTCLLFEERLLQWLNKKSEVTEKLLMFRLPEYSVWIFIGSLLAAFIKTETPLVNIVGMNVLNGILVIYFLQGLAVVGCYFQATKVSLFWRTLGYVLLFTQLFLLVSALGILDYWFDFRFRLLKRVARLKKTGSTKKV